ncbi:MAG: glycoside hydrolase family 97 protein [Ignavibacteria bacterium]|nr:glycoside hydrolase family 97 protein [Ignavibacteria bacterium]
MKKIFALLILLISSVFTIAQVSSVISPNGKIEISLLNKTESKTGEWYLKINELKSSGSNAVISEVKLGLERNDQKFQSELSLVKVSSPKKIDEKYLSLIGKKSQCSNSANEIEASFKNPDGSILKLVVRAYNDGAAFRYEFPEKSGTFVIKDELTSYNISSDAKRWMTKWDLANEGLFSFIKDINVQQTWGYPALFNSKDSTTWFLIHEADLDRTYCGTKLSNVDDKSYFKLTFPDPGDGDGEVQPKINLPWKSPWRVIIIGSLADIVESTLIDDISRPSTITKTDWIKPGVASWNYWSSNHGTKDFKVVCDFADLAASMGWQYTLLDWEWDQMGNGGKLEDALKYIHSLGVKPLMWYNSGAFKWVTATPRDRMLTHQNRIEEFAKLKELGVAGIKVDFFLSEKQDMIKYYLDILEDAAKYEIMIYFHGCVVPRGWARTYPHLMTYEGIRGAEWYNNGPDFTTTAPKHNTIIPFTRNVVGSMDYTPVTFTNSQFPHLTSYGHELAQSVVYESGIQHMADRPSGYNNLPDAARSFLKEVTSSWDDTKLVSGYPGKDIILARRKADNWFIGGMNSEDKEKTLTFNFPFLENGVKYKLTLIADSEHDKDLAIDYSVIDNSGSVKVKVLRRGGFAAILKPIKD